jgi:phosphate starvation-inducible membrane PsiE
MRMRDKIKYLTIGNMSAGRNIVFSASAVLLPIVLAFWLLHLWHWDFTVPLAYGVPGADEVWQLVATKTVLDTGWVLSNPYLGAPDVSQWYNNSGSQTSAIHSILMLGLGLFIEDAVKVQQIYYALNFPLITITAYITCRTFGVARLPAFAAGLLFAFTAFRLHALFFAYLANYFMVPISLIPTIWIMQGKFAAAASESSGLPKLRDSLRGLILTKRFFLGVSIIVLTGISDGYYAFFALLLIGFATFLRAVSGDLLRPVSLVAPVVYILTMFATVLVLSYPVYEYRRTHVEEADQDQMKQPSDAEVYSPTLKLLVAPPLDHRIKAFAEFGKWLVDTTNFNRKFPYHGGAPAVLGTLGTILFAGALTTLAVSIFRRRERGASVRSAGSASEASQPPLPLIVAVLALFVFLCSIQGGLGSLVALVYPSIRAYERFPVFLIFLLFFGAAYAVTPALKAGNIWRRSLVSAGIVAVTALAFLDQTPHDLLSLRTAEGVRARSDRFLAERRFVQKIEQTLPPNAMVYQYPFSQYLTNNKYYGWGAFGQLRLYLHSKTIRWSNGGAKGSPGDNWHERTSLLPLQQLISEMEAVGFQGMVVDRLVLPDAEYQEVKKTLTSQLGTEPVEDAEARLAYWPLRDSPFRITYDRSFKEASEVTVVRPFDKDQHSLPRIVNEEAVVRLLAELGGKYPLRIRRAEHPEVFFPGASLDRGLGQSKISPVSDMTGDVSCENIEQDQRMAAAETVNLIVTNRSTFDWKVNTGNFPLRIGVRMLDRHGKLLEEISVPSDAYIRRGNSVKVSVPLISLVARLGDAAPDEFVSEFKLLQDGNAWFSKPGNLECRISVRR